MTDPENPYAPPDPFEGGQDEQSFYETRHHAGLVFALGVVGLVLMRLGPALKDPLQRPRLQVEALLE